MSDGSVTTNGNTAAVIDLCGAEDLNVPQSLCVDPNTFAMAGVRCCPKPGSGRVVRSSCCHPDTNNWACNNPPCNCPTSGNKYERCMKAANAAEADARCAALDRVVCSKEDVEANKANGKGCYLDFAYVWTSTTCNLGVDAPVL